jgi:hypothetical protein
MVPIARINMVNTNSFQEITKIVPQEDVAGIGVLLREQLLKGRKLLMKK